MTEIEGLKKLITQCDISFYLPIDIKTVYMQGFG